MNWDRVLKSFGWFFRYILSLPFILVGLLFSLVGSGLRAADRWCWRVVKAIMEGEF